MTSQGNSSKQKKGGLLKSKLKNHQIKQMIAKKGLYQEVINKEPRSINMTPMDDSTERVRDEFNMTGNMFSPLNLNENYSVNMSEEAPTQAQMAKEMIMHSFQHTKRLAQLNVQMQQEFNQRQSDLDLVLQDTKPLSNEFSIPDRQPHTNKRIDTRELPLVLETDRYKELKSEQTEGQNGNGQQSAVATGIDSNQNNKTFFNTHLGSFNLHQETERDNNAKGDDSSQEAKDYESEVFNCI